MKIAHLLSSAAILPVTTHHGRYEWVIRLARLQKAQGHEVTIYCHPASHLDDIAVTGIPTLSDDKVVDDIATLRYAFQNNHDVYHSHYDSLHYVVGTETTKPIVYSQHWWPNEQTIQRATSYPSDNIWAVPPTRYMYDFDISAGIQTKGYIYHGIDLSNFTYSESFKKKDRLLFVGRISPEKNLPFAITIAKRAGLGLDIIGKIPEKDQTYWNSIEAMVDGKQIVYHGPKNHVELSKFYADSLGLLFPSDTHEPFGLVAIEAQASGTPVIMKQGGSRSELIIHGKTGYVCSTEEEFITACHEVSSLDPVDCVEFASQFDIHTMANRYEQLYEQILR